MFRLNNHKGKHKSIELLIIGSVLFVYVATLFFQNRSNWNAKSIIGFSIIIIIHILNYIFREKIYKKQLAIYFVVQGIIIFILAYIIKTNYQAAYLGLIPLIIAQSLQLFRDKKKSLWVIFFYYMLYGATVIIYDGFNNLLYSIALLFLLSSAMIVYGYLYIRRLKDYEKTQSLLLELEKAYDTLEEMVRENERQKLARDIHDTLSQGLAGIVMKLEALSVSLEHKDYEKSKYISESSIVQGRQTLKEARRIIHDLRDHSDNQEELLTAIEQEVDLFKKDSNIEVDVQQKGSLLVKPIIRKNIVFIIREILNNIKKHAMATNVSINCVVEEDNLYIRVSDNGIGFDIRNINRMYGHYGIKGMQERANIIKGQLIIDSQLKRGTTITLYVPRRIEGDRNDEQNTFSSS